VPSMPQTEATTSAQPAPASAPLYQDAHRVSAEGTASPGTGVSSPFKMPWGGWKLVIRQMINELGTSQISLAAAGCAFYATLSLFPAISALLSLYGLAFDLNTVEPQLNVLHDLLPPAAYTLIGDRIHTLVEQSHSSLTIGLIFSLCVALWSASASTKSILSALNLAYNTTELRSFLAFQGIAFGTTLGAVLGACLTLALMVALPAFLDFLPSHLAFLHIPPQFDTALTWGLPLVVHLLAPALMLLFVFGAVTLLYRHGPSRPAGAWRWSLPGSLVATGLWLVTSFGFSWYVSHFASYGATYGPLGAVVAIMMWFFVSAYVVLLGAELNAGLEDRIAGLEPKVSNTVNPERVPQEPTVSNDVASRAEATRSR
jgi:membrane protein